MCSSDLARSGLMYVTVENSYITAIGYSGEYWTSTVRPDRAGQAFGLELSREKISPAADFGKNMYPMSVRCLAR